MQTTAMPEKADLRFSACLRGVLFMRGEYVAGEVFGLLRVGGQQRD